jgi:hypothetical protein
LRIERQERLQPLHRVQHDHPDHAEEQHRDRVFSPRHLAARPHPADAIDEPLDRREHRVEEGRLVREDACHVKPERHAQRSDDGKKNPHLENCVPEHLRSLKEDGPLESLGAQKCVDEIRGQEYGAGGSQDQFPSAHSRLHPST